MARPIMVLLETLGRRWALRVLWELRETSLTFRALQAACGGLSPSVLAARLAELGELGVVASGDEGYHLTDEGRELGQLLLPLDQWARKRISARTGSRPSRASPTDPRGTRTSRGVAGTRR